MKFNPTGRDSPTNLEPLTDDSQAFSFSHGTKAKLATRPLPLRYTSLELKYTSTPSCQSLTSQTDVSLIFQVEHKLPALQWGIHLRQIY